MSIKEALGRQPSFEGVQVISDRADFRSEYRDSVLREQFQKGARLLVEAGIPEVLDELADIIRPDFPDVRISNVDLREKSNDEEKELDDRFQYWGDGTVSATVGWDYHQARIENRNEKDVSPRGKMRELPSCYKGVSVIVLPNLEALVIEKFDSHRPSGVMILRASWETPEGKKVVEDAIVEAYRSPMPHSNMIIVV